jgi:hypothetical protein
LNRPKFLLSEAVLSDQSDELPLLVIDNKYYFQKNCFYELMFKFIDLPSLSSESKFLLRKHDEVYRAIVGFPYIQTYLESSETHERLNPYWFFSHPLLYFSHKREKEMKRGFLEAHGMNSVSKATQTIMEHLAEFLSSKPEASSLGYIFLNQNHVR